MNDKDLLIEALNNEIDFLSKDNDELRSLNKKLLNLLFKKYGPENIR